MSPHAKQGFSHSRAWITALAAATLAFGVFKQTQGAPPSDMDSGPDRAAVEGSALASKRRTVRVDDGIVAASLPPSPRLRTTSKAYAVISGETARLELAGERRVPLSGKLNAISVEGACALVEAASADDSRVYRCEGVESLLSAEEIRQLAEIGHFSARDRWLSDAIGTMSAELYANQARRLHERGAAQGDQLSLGALAAWHASAWSPEIEPDYTLAIAYEYTVWLLRGGPEGELFVPELAPQVSVVDCLDALSIGAGIADHFGWTARGGRSGLINGVPARACNPVAKTATSVTRSP